MAARLPVLAAALAAALASGAMRPNDGSLLIQGKVVATPMSDPAAPATGTPKNDTIKAKDFEAFGNWTNPTGMDAGGWDDSKYIPPSVNISGIGMDRGQAMTENGAGSKSLHCALMSAVLGIAV